MGGIFLILSFALIFKGIKVDEWYYIIGGSIISIASAICYLAKKITYEESENTEETYND